jgi:hypothetical protein
MILGGLILPALAEAEGESGGQEAAAHTPAQMAQAARQASPSRTPYGGPGMMEDPRMMGGPYGGRGMMEDPRMMGGPYGDRGMMEDPGMMGSPYGGRGMMEDPGMMGGRYGGPGMTEDPRMMGGPYGGPGMMEDPGMMRRPYAGPGMMRGGPRGRGDRGGAEMMRGQQGIPGQMARPSMRGVPDAGQGRATAPAHRSGRAETGGGAAAMEDPARMPAPEAGLDATPGPQGRASATATPGSTRGGPATAMLDVISRLDLTDEQRGKLDAIRDDLQTREAALIEKITVTAKRLRELQQQHMDADQTLKDLNGHLATANMDAANRAEELLTGEQRRQLVRGGAHITMPTQQTR